MVIKQEKRAVKRERTKSNNALEAMAKGKVVFTGAEQEWLNHYDLKEDMMDFFLKYL